MFSTIFSGWEDSTHIILSFGPNYLPCLPVQIIFLVIQTKFVRSYLVHTVFPASYFTILTLMPETIFLPFNLDIQSLFKRYIYHLIPCLTVEITYIYSHRHLYSS